jgi:FkbM family methyltransferase
VLKRYWQILKNHPRPIKFVSAKLLMKTNLSKLLFIKQKDFTLRFYPTSFTANLWIDPEIRAEDDTFIRKLLSKGDVAVDVGANIGTTVLAASRCVGASGKVYAFEAHPRTFNYLKGNIALNKIKNVQPINTAVGNSVGTVFFSDTKRDDMNSVVNYNSGVEVSIDKLDHLIPEDEDIALLKIDVEGYEKFVLLGAEELLERTACVYFEVYEKHFSEHHYSSRDIINFLKERGFSIFNIHFNDGISLLPTPHDYVAGQCENLLAVKSVEGLLQKANFNLLD